MSPGSKRKSESTKIRLKKAGAIAADIYRVTIVEALDSWLAEGSTGRDLKMHGP